ncbi:MAG: SDR family oxidoreductase [Thermodesulfobacteriota bacterium]
MRELVAVTGADGFIGSQLCKTLVSKGLAVRALLRKTESSRVQGIEYFAIGDIDADTDWSEALNGVSSVVHLAGRVHKMDDRHTDAAHVYYTVNVEGTRRLAEFASSAGVKRIVFLSTVKIHGERTEDRAFNEDDPPNPVGPYATSKWEAERALREIGAENRLEVVVIRPPLVYGPGVRANFLRLMSLVDRGMPLPLGAVGNKRSLVGLGNLVAMILLCLGHPKAAGEAFFVSDGHDLSTPELVRRIATALKRRCVLLPIPASFLEIVGRMLGRGETIRRLVESMQVDTGKAERLLEWTPSYSVDEELARTADWFRVVHRRK